MKLLRSIVIFLIVFCNLACAEPIRLHPKNPHYFLFRGEPAVLITSAEHYGSVINLDFDYIKYLDTLAADGLNYTRIFSGSYVEGPDSFNIEKNVLCPALNRLIVPWARSNTPGYKNGGNKFDLDKWSPAYFKRLRDFIAQAHKRDIIVEVALFSSTYTDKNWANSPLHPANNINGIEPIDRKQVHTTNNGRLLQYQLKMVRQIVTELNHLDNVIYEIQNEPWSDLPGQAFNLNPYDTQSSKKWIRRSFLASEVSSAWQKRISQVITETEANLPQRHLIAQNFCNFKYPLKHVEPSISIINFHYAWPETAIWNYGWDRVLGFDESGFSGKDDNTYRQQAWGFILSGGGVFNNLDYSFVVGYEDGTFDANSPGGGGGKLRKQLKILKDFIHTFDFIRMKPDNSVIKKAPGAIAHALIEQGRQYAIYLSGGNRCDLELHLPVGKYKAEWLNPISGRIDKTESIMQKCNSVIMLKSPEYAIDIVLRIKAVE